MTEANHLLVHRLYGWERYLRLRQNEIALKQAVVRCRSLVCDHDLPCPPDIGAEFLAAAWYDASRY